MALLWALSWLAAAQALEVGDLFGNDSGQVSFWTDPCRQHGSCRLCMAAGCAWQQQAQHCTSAKSLLAEAAGAPQEMCLPEEKVTNFSVDEAHRMARYSYAAYYDQPAGYLSKNAEVVKTFFYTIGAWDRAFGFLAVDRAEKLITLAFRGSETLTQVFVEVLRHTLVPFRGDKQVLVNQFFVHAAEDLLPEITPVLQMQMKSCKSCQLRVTGHSLGAAMAMLVAYNISFWSPEPPVLYTFGQPRTCNFAFAQMAEQRLVLYRVVNGADPAGHL
ncbi:unnamed protein product [Effrenium voratum]|nr:unnamed protein product [Effrenium voratum]